MKIIIPESEQRNGGGEGPLIKVPSASPTETQFVLNNKKSGSKSTLSREKVSPVEADEVYDRNKMVYFVMLVHGIGTLLPWNMLITAKDYFEEYKLGPDYTGMKNLEYGTHFLFYLILVYQLPAVAFNWVNIFVRVGPCSDTSTEHLNKKIIWSLIGQAVMFCVIIVLGWIDTSKWPGVFFTLVLLCVVVISTCAAIYQSSLFGIGARLGYISPLILGSNISGTFTSIVSLISISASPDVQRSAMFSFIIALVIIVVCIASYFLLPRNKFYRYKLKLDQNTEPWAVLQANQAENGQSVAELQERGPPPYLEILKQCWPQCFNVAMIFFITLALFPVVHSEIQPLNKKFFLKGQYFQQVACFLMFNVSAMIGNIIADFVEWPSPDKLWIYTCLRVLFIPAFLLCNYQPGGKGRTAFVLFNDWMYCIVALMFGLTSGYYSSLAFIYCSRSVGEDQNAIAGMFGVAFLVTGLSVGIAFSYIMPYLI